MIQTSVFLTVEKTEYFEREGDKKINCDFYFFFVQWRTASPPPCLILLWSSLPERAAYWGQPARETVRRPSMTASRILQSKSAVPVAAGYLQMVDVQPNIYCRVGGFLSYDWSKVTEIRVPSVALCLYYSESSEEESTGEREEEIHAHNEAACFSEMAAVPAEHGSTAPTGESSEPATRSRDFICSSGLLRRMQPD